MDKSKVEKLIKEVILNDDAQQEWVNNIDPDFLIAIETLIKRYVEDPSKNKTHVFRIGIILGAVYERWRQKNK